jgi:hypothetical protein
VIFLSHTFFDENNLVILLDFLTGKKKYFPDFPFAPVKFPGKSSSRQQLYFAFFSALMYRQ